MAEPFLSEIRLMSFTFPPKGWALCNGQLLPINQNQGLFSLLGTTFGGDGRVNFALPDLRGRVPIGVGNGHTLGERAGSEAVTITATTMPQHTHLFASNN
ncbi:MAG TPA: tail fiber protein, partial [Phnomibacter sp.]|nr:tail fiber protein [Phnomibacter sp.]